MAINQNPMLTAGQAIPADVLRRMLELRQLGQTYDPTAGQWAPSWYHSTQASFQDGARDGATETMSAGPSYIVQPRNISTWGGNDTADMWDAQGNYVGTNAGGTALRGMANLVAQAVGGYYGTQYLNGLEGAAAAGGGAGDGSWLGAGGSGGGSALDASIAEMAAQPVANGVTSLGTIPPVDPSIGAAAGGAAGSAAGSQFRPSQNYGEGMTGAQTGAYDSTMNATGSPDLANLAAQASGLPWANIAGAALGVAGARDQQQTGSRDPWAPAQPFLQQLLGQGQQLAQQYQQHPFSQQQQTAYNNIGGLLNAINSGAGGLLSGMQANASGANNFDRSNPRRPLQGSSFSLGGFQPGLLNFFPQTGGR